MKLVIKFIILIILCFFSETITINARHTGTVTKSMISRIKKHRNVKSAKVKVKSHFSLTKMKKTLKWKKVKDEDSPGFSSKNESPYDEANWMASIPGNLNLRDLSIPGTHDTMTYSLWGKTKENLSIGMLNPFYVYKTIETIGCDIFASAQSMDLENQLIAGIRYLDIRVAGNGNRFEINHGSCETEFSFDQVLEKVEKFLIKNKSETILMRIKHEKTTFGGLAHEDSQSFEQILADYIIKYERLFFFSTNAEYFNYIPDLNEVRGKIVPLVNRSDLNKLEGILNNNNLKFGINWDGDAMSVKDDYDRSGDNKKNSIREGIKNSLNKINDTGGKKKLYLTHCSGYSLPDEPPFIVAKDVNATPLEFKDYDKTKSFGVVIYDFPIG
jgi:hypothetical protein